MKPDLGYMRKDGTYAAVRTGRRDDRETLRVLAEQIARPPIDFGGIFSATRGKW